MPYLSKRQARWANSTGQSFAKRWNKLTDFDALPEQKDSGATGMAIPPTGSNALFNQPGIESRAKRRKKKACTCTTKAAGAPGEKIAPGITRIRGNLCNVHGRYGPCDKGIAGKKPAKGKKPPKAKLTPEQRASERQATRSANADAVAKRMAESDTGLSPSGVKAMQSLASGQPLDSTMGDGLVKMGLAERGLDGIYRMSATGRAAMGAMAAGDYQRAVDTIARAGDTASARRGRQEAATARRTESATRQQSALAKRQAAQAERVARQQAREQAAEKPAKGGSSADGKKPQAQGPKASTRRPSARYTPRSSPSASAPQSSAKPRPKPATPKPEKAPAKQIAPALRSAAQALSDGSDVTDEQLDQLITNGLVKLNRDGDPILTAAGQRATMKAFTVYKDDSGKDRWLAITTTAYEDKDREIISTKAISGAVNLGDTTGDRGPLLYWHVPGLVLGDCDFQAQGGPGGRFLIEGGTFRSKAMAAFGQKLSADGYQMSPGFIHSDNQPVNGVYDHILIYERSAVPHNRAANHFTRYAATKEDKVITPEKIAEYREKAASNPEALALLDTLLSTAQKDDDVAQARNVVFKDAPEWAQALITRIDGIEATVKAFTPASAEQAGETEIEDAESEQMDDGEAEADPGMDDAAFAQMIAEAVVAAITPHLDIEKKMAGYVNEMKGMLGGGVATKEATQAQADQIAALDAKLKELTGDLPSSVMNGAANIYRASQSPLTQLTPAAAATVKEQISQVPAGLSDPNEIAAYQLIFGNS